MGSFNTSCAVSNQTIYYNENVVGIFVIQSPKNPDLLIKNKLTPPSTINQPTQWHVPYSFPIKGIYDDYGQIEPNRSDKNFDDFVSYLSSVGIKDYQDFYDKVWDRDFYIKKNGKNYCLSLVLIHKDVYDAVLKIGEMKFDKPYEDTEKHIISLTKKIKNYLQKSPEKIQDEVASLFIKDPFPFIQDPQKIQASTGELLAIKSLSELLEVNNFFDNKKMLINILKKVIKDLCTEKPKNYLKELLGNLFEMDKFFNGLQALNKPLIPQLTTGQEWLGDQNLQWQQNLFKRHYERCLARMVRQNSSEKSIQDFKKEFAVFLENEALAPLNNKNIKKSKLGAL